MITTKKTITSAMDILISNKSSTQLTLINSELIIDGKSSILKLPTILTAGSTYGGYETEKCEMPYQINFVYSPDNSETLIGFNCELSGTKGITIYPYKKGPLSKNWILAESPSKLNEVWIIRFFFESQ